MQFFLQSETFAILEEIGFLIIVLAVLTGAAWTLAKLLKKARNL